METASPPAKSPDPDPPAILRVENLHKSYRDLVAVQNLSFHLPPGTILGLAGPNGAGKTTTLRSITGIIPVTGGRVEVAGVDLQADPIGAKRHLAYIPDDPRLFDALTVREHLQFTAIAYAVADYRSRADTLLARFSLTDKADVVAQELSRGMRQKVAICCALLHDPKVLLFDEPLTGLDPRGIRLIKEVIREKAAQGGAVIISSHLLSLVEDLCTDLLVLRRGECLFLGPLHQIRGAVGAETTTSLEETFLRMTDESSRISDR